MIRAFAALKDAHGGDRELDRRPHERPESFFAHFEPFRAPPRACARGVLVARTARLWGPLGPIPDTGMLP